MSVVISPSILNCDFGHFADELARISTADYVHVDVMDNHFVPNLALGLPLVEAAVHASPVPVDAHLMIEDPDRWAPVYAEAGCASVTFHAEAASAPLRLAREIRAQGRRVGLALRPATGIEPYVDILGEFDMILVMTVEPGFGGQSFIESMMPKVSRTRKAIRDAGLDVWVQVDGGVSRSTIEKAAQAGANNFVAGSAVYRAEDAAAEVEALRQLAAPHVH
ncbi:MULTISPECIES: ribulose-phosphate 3-epimerase [Actinomycetaceae]|jgi:ribulose-phosphate 3-epimerase|uniref:ribulose-phosphate 3-epimerase n=1 Tax=Actinomycetaceae TaxID=2049 RepID=UPI000397CCAA|nr:ribulose-phosphate 3-epimerase [Actinobaculum sp. oral taxon 183]ERH19876.1 ribulose-phosphate 3-epimerase [Actinobaculum sp. oral taxon 183 str. F0552]RKV69510.1 MAG: ribulose-phosphate 3-epimerase [Actinomyces sp.]